ncbi:MAG: hypothetical protein ACX94B_04225 [Henriciella sp.]|nr:DUF2314 domain-containing protein [Hyphomonadaceae bacterium]
MIRWLAALLILGLAACSPTPGSPAMYKDRDMQNAVAEARSTLPVFFEARRSGNAAYSDFRVTVIMPSSAYGRDYEELSNIRQEFAGFIGETSGGKEVPFLTADIADWRFKDGERYRGGYTRRVMFDMTNAEIPNIRAQFHEEPLP